MSAEPAYQPSDTLHLWYLGQSEQPTLVGTLRTVRANRGVSLRYGPRWLQTGFALSEDLPLRDIEFMPGVPDSAAGAVDDARPDRWGERVIRFIDQPARLSLMEFLYYAGDERFGALGVSTSAAAYAPRRFGPLPALADVAAIEQLVQKVLHGEKIAPQEQRLIAPGATLGGVRPKALLTLQGQACVLKFADPSDSTDTPLIEHASMTLAALAGITVAATQPIALAGKCHAIAVQRFDRTGSQRHHAISAAVALRAAGEPIGYPELAQLLRRRGVANAAQRQAQMHELFRRMVFNILLDNTDDHEKNHALLMTDSAAYALSPAFDILPSGQALGYQQMRVGKAMADSTVDNALSDCAQFGLSAKEATAQVQRVAAAVSGWKAHFTAAGVSDRDIESLAQQVDRPFLREQVLGVLSR